METVERVFNFERAFFRPDWKGLMSFGEWLKSNHGLESYSICNDSLSRMEEGLDIANDLSPQEFLMSILSGYSKYCYGIFAPTIDIDWREKVSFKNWLITIHGLLPEHLTEDYIRKQYEGIIEEEGLVPQDYIDNYYDEYGDYLLGRTEGTPSYMLINGNIVSIDSSMFSMKLIELERINNMILSTLKKECVI